MSKTLLTCSQMAARLVARHPELSIARIKPLSAKHRVWRTIALLGLKPASSVIPSEGQKRAGGALMLYSVENEGQVLRKLQQLDCRNPEELTKVPGRQWDRARIRRKSAFRNGVGKTNRAAA